MGALQKFIGVTIASVMVFSGLKSLDSVLYSLDEKYVLFNVLILGIRVLERVRIE